MYIDAYIYIIMVSIQLILGLYQLTLTKYIVVWL